jgi:hypothetical protein
MSLTVSNNSNTKSRRRKTRLPTPQSARQPRQIIIISDTEDNGDNESSSEDEPDTTEPAPLPFRQAAVDGVVGGKSPKTSLLVVLKLGKVPRKDSNNLKSTNPVEHKRNQRSILPFPAARSPVPLANPGYDIPRESSWKARDL